MNNTELEIERRWLLRKLPPEFNEIRNEFEEYGITQWYTPEGRFRSIHPKNYFSECRYLHTIKEVVSYGVNKEIEKEITQEEFQDAIKSATKVISKIRYIYQENDLKYEIDFIHVLGQDYIILEIELNDIDQKIVIPDFINKFIIREITGDKSLSNFNLARKV